MDRLYLLKHNSTAPAMQEIHSSGKPFYREAVEQFVDNDHRVEDGDTIVLVADADTRNSRNSRNGVRVYQWTVAKPRPETKLQVNGVDSA